MIMNSAPWRNVLRRLPVVALWLGLAVPIAAAAQPNAPESNPEVKLKLSLEGQGAVYLRKQADQSIRYVLTGDGGETVLDADEFAELLYRDRTERSWWKRLLNITSPIGIAWVALGLLGQCLFSGRMIVQWIASERLRQSVVPVAFWWLSLCGASALLVYFVWRKDIVGVLGQATGWIIDARNLYFISHNRKVADTPGFPQR